MNDLRPDEGKREPEIVGPDHHRELKEAEVARRAGDVAVAVTDSEEAQTSEDQPQPEEEAGTVEEHTGSSGFADPFRYTYRGEI